MKKTLSRILAVAMSVSMLATALVGCGSKEEPADTTTAATQNTQATTEATTTTVAETESPYDGNGFLKDDLDPSLNYNNQEITILYWDDVARPEFEVKELTGDLISDAIYARNAAVEERLGLKLNWIGTPGSYSVQENYINTAENDVKSGGEFDVFAAYSMSAVTMTLRGLYRDLLPAQNLNFEQPWWPGKLLDDTTINGKLYFCSGDISTNVLQQMYLVLFNKSMADELKLPDLYEIADQGKWTIDKMSELASNAYSDLNGNSVADINDSFGIGLRKNTMFDGFFLGADMRSIEKDANGTMIIADEFTSEKVHDLLTKIVALFHESNYTAFPQTVEGWTNIPFANGQVLFMVDLGNVTSSTDVAGTSVNYGVLPVPKFDEQQERYVTGLQSGYTMYSASIAVDDATRDTIGAMIECMASESYRQVIPAVYETTMKLKYSSGENDARMYDLIRAGITFDLGNIFAEPLDRITYFAFREAANNANTNWASIIKAKSRILQKGLDSLTAKLAALPE